MEARAIKNTAKVRTAGQVLPSTVVVEAGDDEANLYMSTDQMSTDKKRGGFVELATGKVCMWEHDRKVILMEQIQNAIFREQVEE